MHPSRLALFGLVIALPLWSPPAGGQTPDPLPVTAAPYGIQVRLGLEPQLVMSIAFTRRLSRDGARSGVGIGAGVKFPPYRIGHGSARVNLIAIGHWMPHERWGTTVTSHVYLARGQNRAATIHGLGLELRAAPGYYRPGWSAVADLGWQGTLLAHVRHTAAGRETFDERYPTGEPDHDGPADGWYRSTAHRFRLGIAGARTLGDGTALRLAAGTLFSIQNQGIFLGFAHGQVPAYLEASLRFPR